MEILLVSGYMQKYLVPIMKKANIKVSNNIPIHVLDLVEKVRNMSSKVNCILITDEAICGETNKLKQLFKELFIYINQVHIEVSVIFITRDLTNYSTFINLRQKEKHKCYLYDSIRLNANFYYNILSEERKVINNISDTYNVSKENQQPNNKGKTKKTFFLKNLFLKNETKKDIHAEDDITRKFSAFSTQISRVIGITGHRGSGVTSTVVNIASEAVARGMSVIIVDLDVYLRTINLYFSDFVLQSETYEEIQSSLVRCLARPDSYSINACAVKDKLWVIGLPYSFGDTALLHKFLDSNHIIGLLSVLKQKFNLVLVDFPLVILRKFPEILIHIDTFGLCVNNNYYSIINTIRNIGDGFKRDEITFFNTKSKVIVTKYNEDSMCEGERFTPDKVCHLLSSDISDLFVNNVLLAGYVQYSSQFDRQIELDRSMVCISSKYKQYYSHILLNLI